MLKRIKIFILVQVDRYYRKKVQDAIRHMYYNIDDNHGEFLYWDLVCERYSNKRDIVISAIVNAEL